MRGAKFAAPHFFALYLKSIPENADGVCALSDEAGRSHGSGNYAREEAHELHFGT